MMYLFIAVPSQLINAVKNILSMTRIAEKGCPANKNQESFGAILKYFG